MSTGNNTSSRRSLKSGQNNSKIARGPKHVKGFTTRHLAALDFLRTINMTKEVEIVENGLAVAKRAQGLYDLDSFDPDASDDEVCSVCACMSVGVYVHVYVQHALKFIVVPSRCVF